MSDIWASRSDSSSLNAWTLWVVDEVEGDDKVNGEEDAEEDAEG